MELRDVVSLIGLAVLVLGVALKMGQLQNQLQQYVTKEALWEVERRRDKERSDSALLHATKAELEQMETKLEKKLDMVIRSNSEIRSVLLRICNHVWPDNAAPKIGGEPT